MLLSLLLLLVGINIANSFNTGFWYGETRPPFTQYESVPFANLTVRINRGYQDGPGSHLVKDPFNPSAPLFVGNTINRQSFDTQFVLDMSYAIGIDVNRVYVVGVTKGTVHFSWESTNVIVNFIFLERNDTKSVTLLSAVDLLNRKIQDLNSTLYRGTNVTMDVDSQWGLVVNGWDVSLKLTYAISVVGGPAVIDGYYLNQGSVGICDHLGAAVFEKYCEFERFFEDDVSRALNITYYRVQILFIKSASLDSVLVHFRISPPPSSKASKASSHREDDVETAVQNLFSQVSHPNSTLYKGNVTIRVDPTWGVSQYRQIQRERQAQFTLQYYEYDASRLQNPVRSSEITAYDRCKANRRCNWGVVIQDQSTNDVRYFHKLFDRGVLFQTNTFLDFEDWRLGSRGFSWDGSIPLTSPGFTSIPKARAKDQTLRGAHFFPFDQPSLGPDIPCYGLERNQGLVLDRSLQRKQIDHQEALVSDITGRIQFLTNNIENATMGPILRSRKDVRENLTWVIADFNHWLTNEQMELQELSSSQCVSTSCFIQFNTSSLLLTGAITGKGELKKTQNGTEVALFTFNSIYLGPELKVILVGQRSLCLVSKTSAVINTTIQALPGYLGGFQGGGGVARLSADALSDQPKPVVICDLGQYCQRSALFNNNNGTFSYSNNLTLVSNNINGPGSGNLRVTAFTIVTSARYIQEVQSIRTTARLGQTIAGGFVVRYKNSYSTTIIPHDASTQLMKAILEQNLNLINPASAGISQDRFNSESAGIGIVRVTRSYPDSTGGLVWNITFTTAIGNIDQLTVQSYLTGIDASIDIQTFVQGNEINGTFVLDFQGYSSAPISSKATAMELQQILTQMPIVSTASVSRTDPSGNCDDGLCYNGPYEARGYMWTVFVTTNLTVDNISPTSPTSPLALQESPYYRFTVSDTTTTSLTGIDAAVSIAFGTVLSNESPKDLLKLTTPFSIAFGGAGGSYGGLGGLGYGVNPVGPTYNNKQLTDLIGGSGGCMRGVDPYDINAVLGPVSGLGGSGGGAIEIIASNDITIGSFGSIVARGGDGEQTSQGGGGGGSGGAVLLSSGTSIVMEGLIDVSGGQGGFGGLDHLDLSGGGGGGGRVSMFAESVVISGGVVSLDGGKCGVKSDFVPLVVQEFTISLYVVMLSDLDNNRLSFLGTQFIDIALDSPFHLNVTRVEKRRSAQNGVVHSLLDIDVVVNATSSFLTPPQIQQSLNKVNDLNIAQVVVVNSSLLLFSNQTTTINPFLRIHTNYCHNSGNSGTLYTEAKMTTSMLVNTTNAAEGTGRALYFSNRENTNTTTGSAREAPFSWNGPIYPFEASQPNRITFYMRLDSSSESTKTNYGSLFSLISRGESGLNISSVIGIFFGNKIMHGANFGSAVDEKFFLKRMVALDNYPILDRWYKIDIRIQWSSNTYTILLDDTIAVSQQPFKGSDVDGIRLSVYRSVDVWFDEIYVGFDNTMEFTCPISLRTGTGTSAPVQRHWSFEDVHGGNSNGYTEYYQMQRHYNFLSTVGSIPFDGNGDIKVYQDIKLQYPDGDYPLTQGMIHAGALVYLTNSLRSGKTPLDQSKTLVSNKGLWSGVADGIGGAGDGRQFWYTEYNYNSSLSSVLNGGVAACSSQDQVSWRFEGIVFHYTNLSDMVFGTDGPFYVERPKVLFNAATSSYVMWAVMDNNKRSLALSAVATSIYEDGPFLFRRSFYPDGNTTRDQVIYALDSERAVVGRTYYQTVEFILPGPMMQPIWESAKSRSGTINYRSNYHRAFYDIGYDNYNDIYNQRWRKEDIAYEVYCENKLTGVRRLVPSGTYNSEGFVCDDPSEKKIVIGQGFAPVGFNIIASRFVSPNNSENSWWRPTSVPSVESQAWSSNYRDGYCGIRKLNDDFNITDPNLAQFVPVARNTCSNIADNPIHAALPDKLVTELRVLTTRRAKFIALSSLTYDFLDTTGALNSFEGELESGDLISMIVEMGQFGFESGDFIQSTFRPPVRTEFQTAVDYKIRFSQFIRNVNDRATYSLACVLDNTCKVNFRDQLTSGQF